ncbi:hypothetical protein C8J56DRAFT_896203 [Mycena floridula]|nr:hypothetical protein C8J56DRAFT_896203 [Mycena floridula]
MARNDKPPASRGGKTNGRRKNRTGNPVGRPRSIKSFGDSTSENLPLRLRLRPPSQTLDDDHESQNTKIAQLSAHIESLQKQIEEQEELYGPVGSDSDNDPAIMSRPTLPVTDNLEPDIDGSDSEPEIMSANVGSDPESDLELAINSKLSKRRRKRKTLSPSPPPPQDMILMVPRPDGARKRCVISTDTLWPRARRQIHSAMGYDSDDNSFSISWKLQKDSKDTRNTLDDANDFIGIRNLVSRPRRKNSAPLEIIIIDNQSVVPIGKAGSKSKSARALQQAELIEKARGDAKEQTLIDDWIVELKQTHPRCPEHKSHCWTGHPSGVHVVMTDLRFRNWSTAYVKERTEFPDKEPTITLTKPPANRMFDPDQVGTRTVKPKVPDAVPPPNIVPNIVINMPNIPGVTVPATPVHHRHASLQPSSGGFEAAAQGEWPTLAKFLDDCSEHNNWKRDFSALYQGTLEENDLRGPDDIARCTVAELKDCGIPLGAAKFLLDAAERLKKKIVADVKRRRINE